MTDETYDLTNARRRLSMHEQRRAELAIKLQKSMALKELWMEVFDKGAASSAWVKPSGVPPRVPALRSPNEQRIFRVTNGVGESRDYPYALVPEILGGGRCD